MPRRWRAGLEGTRVAKLPLRGAPAASVSQKAAEEANGGGVVLLDGVELLLPISRLSLPTSELVRSKEG